MKPTPAEAKDTNHDGCHDCGQCRCGGRKAKKEQPEAIEKFATVRTEPIPAAISPARPL